MIQIILAISVLFVFSIALITALRLFVPKKDKVIKALPQSLTRLEVRGGKHHHPVKILENFSILALWWLSFPLFTLLLLDENSQKAHQYLSIGLFLTLTFGSWWWWRAGSFETRNTKKEDR